MSGGKETPRQKMIGMMYLVLTALLALNVSKQIIAAFVTLNDKLDASAQVINHQAEDTYTQFDMKGAGLKLLNGDMTEYNEWYGRATELKGRTAGIVGFLMSECNEMIKASEGEDWVAEKDSAGNIVKLKPLIEITSMDNYDVPTNLFVGGNPQQPNQRGQALRDSIHAFRDIICTLMGTYEKDHKKYSFVAPENRSELHEALKTAHRDDTAKLAQFYDLLTIPERLLSHDHGAGEQPWASVTFDHAPIVAAAAMFTSMKLDLKNAEAMAAEYMLAKVNAPIFDFNTIEPLAIAQRSYVNQGDSLDLRVMIAAYDSNDVAKIRYGIDEDTLQDRWIETEGAINLNSQNPGQHKAMGAIGVKERGELKWRPWEFSYTVGQPMGVVAMPKMRVLYWGYNNEVEGTASGFPQDKVSLSGSGVTLVPSGGGKFIAKVNRGTREAFVNITGKNDDGSTVNLGRYKFVCKPMPPAKMTYARTENGGEVQYVAAKNGRVNLGLDPSVPLTDVNYTIRGGELTVDGINGKGKINSNGTLDDGAKKLMRQSRNKKVNISVDYKDPSGIGRTASIRIKVV